MNDFALFNIYFFCLLSSLFSLQIKLGCNVPVLYFSQPISFSSELDSFWTCFKISISFMSFHDLLLYILLCYIPSCDNRYRNFLNLFLYTLYSILFLHYVNGRSSHQPSSTFLLQDFWISSSLTFSMHLL